MALDYKYKRFRDLINESAGYRILEDDDRIQKGDETVCGSTLYAENETWSVMKDEDWSEFYGRTVKEMNNSKINREEDFDERLFRRKQERTWFDGVRDAIKIVEYRQKHYEIYRNPGAMQTKPEVFATIDELLIFLKAMLERGEYASRSQCDV
jgi:hypothetical protein